MGRFSLSGLNRASEDVAKSVDYHLRNLTAQLQELRAFLERAAWPEAHGLLTTANNTLHRVDDVLEDAKETFLRASQFLDTSTLAVGVLTKLVTLVFTRYNNLGLPKNPL